MSTERRKRLFDLLSSDQHEDAMKMEVENASRHQHAESDQQEKEEKHSERSQMDVETSPVEECISKEDEQLIAEEEYKNNMKTMQFPPLPGNMLNVLKNMFEKLSLKEKVESRAKILRSKLDVFIQGDNNELCQGDERLKRIFTLLNNMGYTRSPDQVLFHHSYIMACLPLIYGNDWPAHSVRVMKTFGLKKLDQLVLVLTPRRIGKTVSVAMFVAALLLCVPGITIAVFSTCQRASTAIMKLVLKIMSGIPGTDRRILSHNKETLMISETPLPAGVGPNSAIARKMANMPGVAVLNCFPASENSKFIQTSFYYNASCNSFASPVSVFTGREKYHRVT
jgi:hypothetical protein